MKKYLICCILATISLIATFAQTSARAGNDTTYMLTYDHGGISYPSYPQVETGG